MSSASGLPYKKVLLIGATSGLGLALANRWITHGAHVIAVGRRADRLSSFQSQHGAFQASTYTFDIGNLASIPSWAAKVHAEHPDLDCVVLNSGIQHRFNFADPASVDLQKLDDEMKINYLAYVHLATAFLPHLEAQSKTSPAALMATTSGLALMPFPGGSNYSASKAALHQWLLALRVELRKAGSAVKVIEIMPPAVQTELHGMSAEAQKVGIPIEQFLEETWEGLVKGQVQAPSGWVMGATAPGSAEAMRQEAFEKRFG